MKSLFFTITTRLAWKIIGAVMTLSYIITNYRTSALGIAAILGAVADGLHQIGTNSYDYTRLHADYIALVAGFMGLMAKDGAAGQVKQ